MTQTDKAALTDRLSNIGMVTPTLSDVLKDVSKLDAALLASTGALINIVRTSERRSIWSDRRN